MSSVESAYDGLGRVIGLSYREDVEENEYTLHNNLAYNLQGWMNGCSAGYENDFFLSRLHFDDPLPGDAPSYTGNVSSWWTWHDTGEDYSDNEFGFSYDRLGRLTATRSVKGGEQDLFGEDLSYDLNGNITSLTRREGSSEGTTKSWTYTGNRRSGHSYDAAGNIRSGGMPGVESITYNILGLPSSVSLTGVSDHTVEYAYLLDGTKTAAVEREKITFPPIIPPMPLSEGETAEVQASLPTDLEPIMMRRRGYVYAGPFRFYVNDYDSTFVLESVAFSEGRIVRKELSNSSFIYEPHFFIKDHLGSVRAVVKADGEILQQNDYQPYGEKILADGHASGENDYLYCGKEFQSFFDLPFYDSGARFQRNDGIFLSVDPLAEKYYGISPYAYCSGDPINRVDPEGRDGMITGEGTKDSPFVITAKYFYDKDLPELQVNGLLEAINDYNSQGVKQIKINGNTIFVMYNLSAELVEDPQNARGETSFMTEGNEVRYYGNTVGKKDLPTTKLGCADGIGINFDVENINIYVDQNGASPHKTNKGTAIHEIGHNLGGEHEHGTSTMQKTETIIKGNNYIYIYPTVSKAFTKIIIKNKDLPKINGGGRIWTKKR